MKDLDKSKKDISEDSSKGSSKGMPVEEFFDPGEICKLGASEQPIEELIQCARDINPGKRIRIVDDWTWLDIKDATKAMQIIEQAGFYPVVLFALTITYDSEATENIGGWVLTTFLKKFYPPGIFETRNTLYVMTNVGRRKTVPLSYVNSII